MIDSFSPNTIDSSEAKKTIEKAIKKFGEASQIIMTIEETSELTQALTKCLRGHNNQDNIAEEIADIYIVLKSLEMIFNNENEVDNYIKEKISRLKKIVDSCP